MTELAVKKKRKKPVAAKRRVMNFLIDAGVPKTDLADTERRLPIPNRFVTQDLFGFCDFMWLRGNEVIAVQVTSGSNHAAHQDKIEAEPRVYRWLHGDSRRVLLWSIRKSARTRRYVHRVEEASMFWEGDIPGGIAWLPREPESLLA